MKQCKMKIAKVKIYNSEFNVFKFTFFILPFAFCIE